MSLQAPPSPQRGSSRRTWITAGIALVVLVLVFGVILPQVLDYQQVWETFKAVEPQYLLLLLAAGLIYYIPEGWLYAIVLPGLSLWRGIKAWVASTATGSTAPAIDLVTRYGMYRSWGSSPSASMQGIFLSGVFDWVVKFTIPILAVLALAVSGVQDLGFLLVIAVAAAVFLTVVLVTLIGGARSPRFANWLSDRVSRLITWVLARFGKQPPEDLPEQILTFRDEVLQLGGKRAGWALLASALGKFWQYVMLLIALRAVGIPEDVLGPVEILVAWALVLLITMIPITPGGIGVAALFYVWFLVSVTGNQWANAIAAGVLLYRVFQWALPIPIGWAVVWGWRRQIRKGRIPDPFAVGGSS